MAHKNIPTRTDIDALAAVREAGTVSIYTPSGPLAEDGEKARIELKNQLREAVNQLKEGGSPKSYIEKIESDIDSLLENRLFWQYQSNSLVTFVSESVFETFQLPNKLTATMDIADRFYIKPLVRAITFSQSAFVLAVSGNSVRLIKVTADQPAREVDATDLPKDMESHLNLDLAGKGTFGRRSEDPEVRQMQYTTAINKAILPVVRNSGLPLIIAAAEPMASIYRRTNGYKRLSDQVISGNSENLSAEALAAKARPILDDLYAKEIAELKETFGTKSAHGLGSANLEDVASASIMGAIATLMIDIDQRIPGFLDEETGAVKPSRDDDAFNYGVGDEILRRALTGGAKVYGVRAADMPEEGAAVAATFRFPIAS